MSGLTFTLGRLSTEASERGKILNCEDVLMDF